MDLQEKRIEEVKALKHRLALILIEWPIVLVDLLGEYAMSPWPSILYGGGEKVWCADFQSEREHEWSLVPFKEKIKLPVGSLGLQKCVTSFHDQHIGGFVLDQHWHWKKDNDLISLRFSCCSYPITMEPRLIFVDAHHPNCPLSVLMKKNSKKFHQLAWPVVIPGQTLRIRGPITIIQGQTTNGFDLVITSCRLWVVQKRNPQVWYLELDGHKVMEWTWIPAPVPPFARSIGLSYAVGKDTLRCLVWRKQHWVVVWDFNLRTMKWRQRGLSQFPPRLDTLACWFHEDWQLHIRLCRNNDQSNVIKVSDESNVFKVSANGLRWYDLPQSPPLKGLNVMLVPTAVSRTVFFEYK